MERLIGFAVIAYLIYSFVSAIFQQQQRSGSETTGDDAPWPHLENEENSFPVGAEPIDPTRPVTGGPGPIFWPDLFRDPRETGAPHGWPTEMPEPTREPVYQKPQRLSDSKEASEPSVASTSGAEEVQMSAMLAGAETDLLRRLAEREDAVAAPRRQETVTAAESRGHRVRDQAPFELTADSLRQAILYTEVLGPPRALRPYRPPSWR